MIVKALSKNVGHSGFSLIEAMIAMSVSGIIILGILSTLDLVYSGGAKFNLTQARNEIINTIRTQSISSSNLVASAKITETLGTAGLVPDHGEVSDLKYPSFLKNCIPDLVTSSSFGCDKSVLEEPGRGYLFYLTQNSVLDSEKTVAGEDVYYSNTGARCSSAQAASPDSCPIFARVWFEPFCLNFATSCNKAMSLVVRYAVGIRSDYDGKNKNSLATSEGEFYIPLQRGIQIKNLLTQSNFPIYPNSKGIYAIPKYYGTTSLISGLRFETIVSNPNGLVSMKIQGRSLTGPDAKNYDDSAIPTVLLSKPWQDVLTPDNPGAGAWSIDLAGSVSNQTFNFGTQSSVVPNSRVPTSFMIGSSDPNDATYRWTQDLTGGTGYVAPTFKSGVYQFRVVAADIMGGQVESSNYITVRLISTPELIFIDGSFDLERDCVNTAQTYSILVADDEELVSSEVKVNNKVVVSKTNAGTTEKLDFSFTKSQASGIYPITITLKNKFSDIQLEKALIPKVVYERIIDLKELPTSTGDGLVSNPSKVVIGKTAVVSLNYTTGTCCTVTPKVNWAYLTSPDFGGVSLLSGAASSNMTCSITDNKRTCVGNNTVTGIKEGPTTDSPPPDIQGILDLGASISNPACKLATVVDANIFETYIPVISLPNIAFLLSESLWLDVPPGPPTGATASVQSYSPRIAVRMDFAPPVTVKVDVVDNTTSAVKCTLTFAGSGTTGGPPVDQFCDIQKGYSGKLILKKNISSVNLIKSPSDAADPKYVAKMEGSELDHAICQIKLTDLVPAQYPVPISKPMNDSPYGKNADGTQNVKNDYMHWNAGELKNLKCFDYWSMYKAENSPSFVDTINKQDYYDAYVYNTDTAAGTSLVPKNKYFFYGYGKFLFPNNPPILIDESVENIPYLYIVMQEGAPNDVIWGDIEKIDGVWVQAFGGPKPWQNIDLRPACGGSGSPSYMNKIRLYKNKASATGALGYQISTINRAKSSSMTGTFSYNFYCSYGRWHPSGYGYTSDDWTK